ncbi:arylsulfatase [Snuella sedimenti]|uniref:Arylsulfatase n=1 Tax=Snuella sedimenti TaxID=2798802 RepID=A0A8J7IF42_9FLAO|nr:arylsulfatase [Snuella sedimenti]MBJ6367352.1 arylsulfatase [Snuella sedimenti]
MKSLLKTTTFLLIFICFVFNYNCKSDKDSNKPNIIIIYADDLGKGLLSHEGQDIIKTPNIDKLATEGLRFENAYAGMLCAPSRASLISGKHDCHEEAFEITPAGIYKNISNRRMTFDSIQTTINNTLSPISDNQIFLGQVAKEAGYITGQIGKLEWGFAATDQQMKRHGWDYYYGYLDHVRAHGFYPPFLFENGKTIHIEGNTLADCGKSHEPETSASYKQRWDMTGKGIYSQTLFMEKALDFISAHKDQPFFLYFPTQLPHGPVSIPKVNPAFENDDRLTQIEKEYASMVTLLDDNVGQIMQHLKALDIDDNTIVIFTSDNGHEIYYALEGRVHKPYTNMTTKDFFDNLEHKYYSELAGDVFNGNDGRAGMKRSNLQGGIEVPLIIRWPKRIKGGTVSQRLTANYDILATLADITGFTKPLASDGKSFYSELNSAHPISEHEFVVYSSFEGPTLITNDGWKIRTYLKKDVFALYYLPDDYREENNLANSYPEKLEILKTKLLEACDNSLINGLFNNKKYVKL